MKYKIRKAIQADLQEIIKLCEEHALYEKANYSSVNKLEKLSVMLFNENPILNCLIVLVDNNIVGYATYSFEVSTWYADIYTHLDCLFLRENYRSNGIGKALIDEIIKYSKAQNAHHIEWQTPQFNIRAINFYNNLGATSKEKLRFTLTI